MRHILYWLAVLALASPTSSACASGFEGQWFIDDKPCSIRMTTPTTAVFINERGESAEGTFRPGFVSVWGMNNNVISQQGPTFTILFENGSRWTKTDIAGGYAIIKDGKAHGCQVLEVAPGRFSFINEHGDKVAAYFVNPYKLRVEGWNLDCTVVFNGKSVEMIFSNGTSWIAPWMK